MKKLWYNILILKIEVTMTVKNVSKYHDLSFDQLNQLGTRELVSALESARGRIICSCGKGCHCGDSALDSHEIQWNTQQAQLYKSLKMVLSQREDLADTSSQKPVAKKEKKKMKY